LVSDISLKNEDYYDQNTGKYTFTDGESFAGYNYYYNVRSYDTGHDTGSIYLGMIMAQYHR